MDARLRLLRNSVGAIASLAIVTVAPSVASADDVPAPLTNDQNKSAVSGRKSAEWWNAPSDSKVDSYGAFSDTIAIEVPGFRGITPELALRYRSDGGNGWVGVGWNLGGVSRIERARPGKGAPRYDASDIYLLDGEELVPCASGSTSPSCTTGGTHSTKTESYERIALSGTGLSAEWTITSKDGTRRVYGVTFRHPGADGTSGNSDDQPFRFGLKQVIDTKGNTVTYTWAANPFGGLWDSLDSITYNGTTIKLYYEARADIETAAIGGGQGEQVYGRLKTIDVKVGSSRVRSYALSYITSGATARSLLASVQQFGKDATLDAAGAVTGGTSLPAITAGYPSATSPSWSLPTSDLGMGSSAQQHFLTMDVNGDGKTDMVEVWRECVLGCTAHRAVAWISNDGVFTRGTQINIPAYADNAQFLAMDVDGDGKDDLVTLTTDGSKWKRRVHLSTGTTFSVGTTDTEMTYSFELVDGGSAGDETDETLLNRFVVGDVNGDGKTDMVEFLPKTVCHLWIIGCVNQSKYYHRVTWLSNGSGFTKSAAEDGIRYDEKAQFYAADFDGDGKADIINLQPVTNTADVEQQVWLSTGTGFTLGWDGRSWWSSSMKFLVGDVNGDGKADLVELLSEGVGTRRKVFLSTGSAFTMTSSTWSSWPFSSARYVMGDVNGDGKSDYIAMTPNVLEVKRTIHLSTGTDFVQGQIDTLGNQGDHRYFAADLNGDGRSDLVELYDELAPSLATMTRRRPWLVAGQAPDLLTSLGGGLGGTTTVAYTPSSAWTNTNNPPLVQTVSSVTVADGRGTSGTTTYSYAGGRYDAVDQRFVGFSYKKETQPCITGETQCPYTETTYSQDKAAAGSPTRIDERNGAGVLLRSKVLQYTQNGTTAPWTALPTNVWEYTYINSGAACPGADCKRTNTTRAFNAYGEVTQATNRGDYDVTGDEDLTTTTYVPNTTAYIVNRPSNVRTYQGTTTSGTLLRDTVRYYDGATSSSAAPTAGYATKVARWLSSPSSYVETKTEYDAWGNVTAVVNPLSARTEHVFDATYHLYPTTTTNAIDQDTTTTWDAVCGVPTQSTNLNGQATTYTYDALCRLVQKTEPGGRFEKHTWLNLGTATTQYEQVERPAADGTTNKWWSRRYFDGLNRTWRELTKGPDTTTGNIYVGTSYNARGLRASQTLPYYTGGTTYATTYDYDALDRVVRTTNPDASFSTKTYGLWSVTETDELGHAKADRFDARGRRVAHDELIAGTWKSTVYTYDARGALQQTTDPSSNVVTYTTDSLGRRRSMVDPSSGTWSYEYDGNGRLTAQVDSKSQRTTFGYDALDRKTSKTSRATTPQAVTVTWTYDEPKVGYYNLGNLTTVTDPAGTKELDYDVAGRVVGSTRTIDGASYTFSYGFDAGDRPLWTTYPDGDTLGTSASPLLYDSAGRLKTIPGYVSAVTYNAAGDVTQLTNANTTVTTRTYSATRGWLTGISTVAGSTTIQNLVYTRNNKGLVTGVTSPIANEGWTYGYDDVDRVTSATNASSSTHNQTLTYDAIGNISTNSRRGTYTYGTRPHAATAAGSSSYTYDGAGLMSTAPNRTMTWDGDNRLATVTNAGVTSTFTYDADGERIQQVEGTTNRRYLGDDYEITALTTTTKYIEVGGTLVARKEGTAKTWIHTDHLGSVQAETGGAGAVVYRKQYRPYGEILSSSGTIDYEPRGFTGERQDASGLIYLHARYYDPALGRFLSPDIIVDGTDTVGLNRHAYVGNNPINATDPTGLAAVRPQQPRAGKERRKSEDPPPPPPPPPPPSYPKDEVAPSASTASEAPAPSPNVSRPRSVTAASGRANVARSASPSQRTSGAATMARATTLNRRDNTRSRNMARSTESSGRRAPARQPEVQLLTEGPLDPDDEEDWVIEIWANLMRDKFYGPEEWDRLFGDGS